MDNNIKHQQNDEGGSFSYHYEGKRVGEMFYTNLKDGKLSIDHTEVDPSMEGKGIGKLLLEELVYYVRENKIKVIARCSFASAKFKSHPEWQDVLY